MRAGEIATATLPEIVFGTLKKINELENIKKENCCEYIAICENTMKYLAERESVSPSEENKYYQNLEDQIVELCTHITELKDRTLTCSLRDRCLTVSYNDKNTSVDKLPDGYYFLRKQDQMVNSIRYKKSELKARIAERLKAGWKNSEMVVESANLEFLNKIYKGKGDN